MLCKTYHLKAESMRNEGVWDDNVVFYYESAAQVAKELLELNANHLEALLGLAQAEFALGQLEAAEATASRAVEAHPSAAGGHIIVGRVHLTNFIDAKTRLNQASSTMANRSELEAEVERLRGLAVAAFTAASTADPDRAYPLVALGDIAAWMGDFEAAFAEYAKAMRIDPQAPIKHDWLRQNTDVESRVALYDSVREAYLQAERQPGKALAIVDWYRALARFDRGNWREASAIFASTLETLPEIADTYYYLLQSAYWSGDEAGCMSYSVAFARKNRKRFADLARGDQRCLSILRIMAKKSFEAENFEESRDLNQVMAFASQSAADWNNYAFLCRKTGKFEDAYLGYQMALSAEPNSPQLMNDAAVILQHDLKGEENLAEARQLYEKAIELAEKMLADGGLSAEEKARTEKALSDAKLNLAEMDGD
jgi:tetratricopeptide (TPR) repeat protein